MSEEYLQCRPAPTDADLAADRDRAHTGAVQEWLAENGDILPATSVYQRGWYAAFAAAQELLAEMIDNPGVQGAQRFALIMASERLAHLANGRETRR